MLTFNLDFSFDELASFNPLSYVISIFRNVWILRDNNRDIKFMFTKGTSFKNKYENESNKQKNESILSKNKK